MTNSMKQQAFQVFELLTEHEQNLVFELIKSLAPDDLATSDDIAAHVAAMQDYRSGETVNHGAIDWN